MHPGEDAGKNLVAVELVEVFVVILGVEVAFQQACGDVLKHGLCRSGICQSVVSGQCDKHRVRPATLLIA